MPKHFRQTEEWLSRETAKRSRWQRGSEVTTDGGSSAGRENGTAPLGRGFEPHPPSTFQSTKADAPAYLTSPSNGRREASSGPITLPWPPSGNTAVRHANGAHYLRPEVIAYRDSVAALCAGRARHVGRYRLAVWLSPPDARRRDADNALKSILDALVKCGFLEDDSMNHMRELLVMVDDDRRGNVRVEVRLA